MERDNYNILTDEELVKMAQEGSVTAEEFLINKYKELAKIKSSMYFIVGGDREDVIQEGMIGIFKAIREFQEEKNASFRRSRKYASIGRLFLPSEKQISESTKSSTNRCR